MYRAFFLVLSLFLFACNKAALFGDDVSYSDYPRASYNFYQDPLSYNTFLGRVDSMIDQLGYETMPGLYAEYGYVTLENGLDNSVQFFEKEAALWPQSKKLIDILRKKASYELTINSQDESFEPPQDIIDKNSKLPSILVLPPINETFTVSAGSFIMPSVNHVLNSSNFYTMPAYPVRRILEDSGFADVNLLHSVEPKKLSDLFGADYILYIKLVEWSSKYLLVNTRTRVTIEYKLVDPKGNVKWENTTTKFYDSMNDVGDSDDAFAAACIVAILHKMMSSQLMFTIMHNVNYTALQNICIENCKPDTKTEKADKEEESKNDAELETTNKDVKTSQNVSINIDINIKETQQ